MGSSSKGYSRYNTSAATLASEQFSRWIVEGSAGLSSKRGARFDGEGEECLFLDKPRAYKANHERYDVFRNLFPGNELRREESGDCDSFMRQRGHSLAEHVQNPHLAANPPSRK